MDFLTVLTLAGMLAFIGVTMFIANQEEADKKAPKLSQLLLYLVLAMMFLLAPSAYFLTTAPDYTGTPAQLGLAVVLVAAGVIASYAAVSSAAFRYTLQGAINKIGGNFYAASGVHITAFVLMVALFLWNTIPFIMQGGIEGYARAMQESGVSVGEPVINAILQIAAAFLGVGLYIRRTPQQSFERLGLRIPTLQDVRTGAAVGFLLLLGTTAFGIIWQIIQPEISQQQSAASNEIAASFSSVPLAFLLATCAAFGEEIFMRGALQPVFGVVGSSIFFASLHAQYLITPSLLLIFVVSLVLGLLRKRLSTNAAIVAHFVFNFLPLALYSSGNFQ